jgi:excisionase family DNA binding protein
MEEELLTKEEVQKYLKISQSTLNLMMKRKEIPYVKLQRRVLFRKKDIDKFLESKLVK